MIDLTALTQSHVAILFRAEEVAGAERLLAHECADTLPLNAEAATPVGSGERIEAVQRMLGRAGSRSMTAPSLP